MLFNHDLFERQKLARIKILQLHKLNQGYQKGPPVSSDQLDEMLNIQHLKNILDKYYD
jgi:hypothetical protein